MGSACWVYAIVGRDTTLPSADSASGLAMVPWRELAAVTARRKDDDAPLAMDAVLHHEAVVEAVRRAGPALPVRFGTVFRDATSVASALAERYDTLSADLERLGDKVEMSLTALWAAPSSGDGSAAGPRDDRAPSGRGEGARYLHARATEQRRDDEWKERARVVARELDGWLGGLALERRELVLPSPRIAVRTAYLLAPAAVGAFRTAFEAMRGTQAELRVLLTGPWPPYSFVRRTEGEGGGASDGRLPALVRLLTDAMRGRPG